MILFWIKYNFMLHSFSVPSSRSAGLPFWFIHCKSVVVGSACIYQYVSAVSYSKVGVLIQPASLWFPVLRQVKPRSAQWWWAMLWDILRKEYKNISYIQVKLQLKLNSWNPSPVVLSWSNFATNGKLQKSVVQGNCLTHLHIKQLHKQQLKKENHKTIELLQRMKFHKHSPFKTLLF